MFAWMIYDIYCKFQKALDIYHEKGLEQALEYAIIEVGKEAAFTLLAAGAGKLIGKLATTPAAKKFFKALQRRLKNGVQKISPGLANKIGIQGVKEVEKKLLDKELNKGKNRVKKNLNSYIGQSKSSLLKSQKSYQELLKSHENKLREYIANPAKFDNKGLLKNATTKDVKNSIIQGRIKVLKGAINRHKNK